jgi:hypothetical protein
VRVRLEPSARTHHVIVVDQQQTVMGIGRIVMTGE